MVYKNFFLRLLFTILFVLIYLFFASINFNLVFYLILFIYTLIFLEIYIYFNKFRYLPILYIFISLLFFINIDFNNNIFKSFNLFIIIVVTFDVFSYIFGKIYGKTKLTKISPNKTVEGLIYGLTSSFFISLTFSYILEININLDLIFFTILIIFGAFLGDIFESFCKRKNDIKNSSELIPGHGGVFDRFDSFVFAIIIFSISLSI